MPKKPSTNKSITLIDVAEAAGVSAITVSRAIRTPQKVSPKAREKVERAINKLGYTPDPAASALASHRTDVVALLVPSLTNSVFADVLRGIYDGLDNSPFSVQIGNYQYAPSNEEKLIRTFLRQKPACLIVAGMDQTAVSVEQLQSANCPVVQIMDHGPSPIDLSVGLSHEKAAGAGVEHLLDCGYKYPAFLGARMDPRSQKRLAGFKAVTERTGHFDPKRVLTTTQKSSVGMGGQLFADLLAVAPETDAILCNNDDLAVGAMSEALRRNISIPGELGVCGFNNLEISHHLHPRLTSVATPLYEIGAKAVELAIAAINGNRPRTPSVDLGFSVIKRETTRTLT